MKNLIISSALLFVVFCGGVLASSGTCDVIASLAARTVTGSSWTDTAGTDYQIFDITIQNSGTCSFSQASLTLQIPSGSTISQAWNYDLSTHAITNFVTLQPGLAYTGAGVVVTNGGIPTVLSSSATCAPSCGNPTNIDTNCQLSVTQTRRTGLGSSWVTQDGTFQIYDLTFTNTGSETLTFAQFDEALSVGTPGSFWDLTKVCCTQIDSAVSYDVTLPGGGLVVGASISAGYILQYDSSLTLTDPEFVSPIVQTAAFDFVLCA